MGAHRRLLRHLSGRPLLRRVLLSEALGPPRSKQPHPTARPKPPPPPKDTDGE